MKKYIILSLLLLTSCTNTKYTKEKEDYNYLEDNSIRFIKTDNTTNLLINKSNKYYLILLDKEKPNIDYDYLIDTNNIKTTKVEDIEVTITSKIEIKLNNQKICIYKKELNKDDYKDCNYLYLYKIEEDFNITLYDNIVLFYDAYTKFNYKFMYSLAKVWIDAYTIDKDSYTTLTIKNKDYEVTTYKRRGKTIHKRQVS